MVRVFLLLALLADSRVSIRTSAAHLFEGGSLRVTCTVPHAAANRTLQIALDGYSYSTRDISEGPVTTELSFKHIPCEVTQASCTVRTDVGKEFLAVAPITVVCQ